MCLGFEAIRGRDEWRRLTPRPEVETFASAKVLGPSATKVTYPLISPVNTPLASNILHSNLYKMCPSLSSGQIYVSNFVSSSTINMEVATDISPFYFVLKKRKVAIIEKGCIE